MNFSFDYLGLDYFFKNYFANELMGRFLSNLKHL
jgi:hypothetical protein